MPKKSKKKGKRPSTSGDAPATRGSAAPPPPPHAAPDDGPVFDDAFEDDWDYAAEEYKPAAGDAGAGDKDKDKAGGGIDDDEPRDGGATLQCLGDHMAEIKRKACRAEVPVGFLQSTVSD